VSSCLVCQHSLEPFLSFGRMPLADAFVDPARPTDEFFFTLAAALCERCGMVQLCERVPDAYMFHDAYAYYSSTSAGMRRHFAALAGDVQDRIRGAADPFVVEIGCNDGILLEPLAAARVRHLGLDPAGNVLGEAARRGLTVRQAFFGESTAAEIAAAHGRADVIVAANVICHIADIHSVFAGIERLLAPAGLFIFEDPYIGAILDSTALDQIYDEHVFYFSVSAVRRVAEMHGLQIVDVAFQRVHGGELRYSLGRRGEHRPTPAVDEWIRREEAACLASPATYQRFAVRAASIRDDLRSTIRRLVSERRRIAGYGATSKSSTIINYCGLGPGDIEFIADVTPGKQGKLTPGAHIPVRSPEFFHAHYPDYAVLFAWNHEREIRERESAFEARGGRWITYVPAVTVGPPACCADPA
jgi:methylation protein EvaC